MNPEGIRTRVAVLALLASCVLPAAGLANNCADGGRPRPDEGGIGGTGARPVSPDEDDSGIGGTGVHAAADSGIIGTITGFASICVGGIEIHYGAATPVEIDGAKADAAQLEVGEVVEVIARGTGDERTAEKIAVRHIVAGPVTGVDAAYGEMEVMGQRVRLTAATHGAAAQGLAAAPTVASYVRVSGMRRADGIVVASRIDRLDPRDVVELSGPVMRTDAGSLIIAGTTVRVEQLPDVSIGREVRVIGRWDAGVLVARSLDTSPEIPFHGSVTHLRLEGFPSTRSAGRLTVGGVRVELSESAGRLLALEADSRVRVEAVLRDGRLIGERIDIVEPPHPLPGDARLHHSEHGHVEGVEHGEPQHGGGERSERSGGIPPLDSDRGGAPAPQRPDAAGPGRPERPERAEPAERPEPPDRPELPDHHGRPEIPERPPRPERPEPPDRPQPPRPR